MTAPPATTSLTPRDAADLDDWLRGHALPLWSSVGVDESTGSFQESIALDGLPARAPHRLRVQARQIYVFAEAHGQGWPGPWRDVAQSGLAFMLRHFQRPDGAFRTLVDIDGAPLDDTAALYDHAFVLFALASCHRIGLERETAHRLAEQLLFGPLAAMRDPAGVFLETSAPIPRQSNPNMHLLEAALAWEAQTGAPCWSDLADAIVAVALSRFIDPHSGAVREFFGEAWVPAPGEPGRILDTGHQFEWCWLLERWGRLRGRADACAAATALFAAGVRGLDVERGVALDTLFDDFSPRASGARLWPQTEWLKASLILAERGDQWRADYLDHAARAVAALRRYLDTPLPGAWRDKLTRSEGFVDEPAPATSLYHIACALAELRASAAATPPFTRR